MRGKEGKSWFRDEWVDISKLKSTKNTAKHSKKIQELTDTEEISAVGMLFINWELYTNVFKILPSLKTRPAEQAICPKIHSMLCFLMY